MTQGFDARLANRPFLVFDFRALNPEPLAYLGGGIRRCPLADVNHFLATKCSAIYANFAIFLTPEDTTKYATASGGLHPQTPYRDSALGTF